MQRLELEKLLNDMSLNEKIEQLVQLHGGFFGEVDTITGPGADYARRTAFSVRSFIKTRLERIKNLHVERVGDSAKGR